MTSRRSAFLDAAIGVLERAAAAKSQRMRALKFLRSRLQGQAPQAGDAGERTDQGAADRPKTPRPAKR